MFQQKEYFPGVRHIQDSMGVCMTLLTGSKRAMLIDTGYGLENTAEYIRSLTALPVDVLLTHGHHDHVLGAAWFPGTQMAEEDLDEFRLRTGREQREKVASQAAQKGLSVPPDFMTRPIREPEKLTMNEEIAGFAARTEDLGGMKIQILHVPGHTEGSIMLYLPEYRLLLTGDDWNPCTWLWFPCSIGVQEWRHNMEKLLDRIPFEYTLCSHQLTLKGRHDPEHFIRFMTDKVLKEAPPADMGSSINTHQVLTDDGQALVFDYDKFSG